MFNFVQLQDDMTAALANRDKLASVNVVSYRRMMISSEINIKTILTTIRNGRYGAGCIVEMPEFNVPHPNLPGPEGALVLKVVVMENPQINLNATQGTLLSAEEIAQWVLDTLHGFRPMSDAGFTISASKNAVTRAQDYELPGVLAYRVFFEMRFTRAPEPKCGTPTMVNNSGTLTLTNDPRTPGAEIFYSLDGNFPARYPGPGQASFRYAAPFTPGSGQTVRWVAYLDGYCFSQVGNYKVP